MLASHFEGKRLNSPNDIVVKKDGSVWFSDPDYGTLSDYTGDKAESEIDACNVYRIDPNGTISLAVSGLQKPNGLAFSPDEKTLYVADSGATHNQGGYHHIFAFDVEGTSAKNGRKHAEIKDGVPDGFRVDIDGNLWVATVHAGVEVFSNEGELIGRIEVPGPTARFRTAGPSKR